MNKFLWTATISGVGMSLGGVGFLTYNEYDVLNPQMWKLAGDIVLTDPGALVSAAMSGANTTLFRGVLFSVSGVGVLAVGWGSASVVALSSSLFSSLRFRNKRSFNVSKSTKIKSAVSEDGFKDEAKQKRLTNPFKKSFMRDKEFDLEGDEVPDASKFGINISNLLKRDSNSTQRVRIRRPLRQRLSKIIELMREYVDARLQRTQGSPTPSDIEQKDTVVDEKSVDLNRLNQWYEKVQAGSVDPEILVGVAREICQEWSVADFEEFEGQDTISGPFISRLVKSWADREDTQNLSSERSDDREDLSKPNRDKEAMREAVRALRRGDAGSSSNEPNIDLEDEFDDFSASDEHDDTVDMEDDEELGAMLSGVRNKYKDIVEDDDESPEQASDEDEDLDPDFSQMMTQTMDRMDVSDEPPDVDILENEAGDELVTSGYPELTNLLREMRQFASHCADVMSGQAEWSEEYSEEYSREEFVSSASSELSMITGIHLDVDINILVQENEEDNPEFAWLAENLDIVEKGYVEFIQHIIAPEFSDDLSETDGDEGDESEDATVPIDSQDGADTDPLDILGGDDTASHEDSSPDEQDASPIEDSVEQSVNSENLDEDHSRNDLEEPDVEDVPAEMAADQSNDDDVDEAIDAVNAPNDSDQGSEAEGSEHNAEENADTHMSGGDDAASDDAVQIDSDEGEEDVAPVDVGIDPSREIDEGKSIPLDWGKQSKKAGATGGALARFVFSSGDKSISSLGIVHVVMVWKLADGEVRFNVILKKLTPGDWSIVHDGDITATNEKGEFVVIPEALLSHSDITESRNVVHFYGDGVTHFEDMAITPNIVATNEIWDVDKIKDFVKK